VVDALTEHLRHYTAKSPEAFVFLSSQGRQLRRSNFNRRVWQPAIWAAGVEGLRVEDLRHTAGTHACLTATLREVTASVSANHRGTAVLHAVPAGHARP
jgi:integrase